MTTKTTETPRYATVNEAAAYARFEHKTIRGLIARGALRCYAPSGARALRVNLNELDALMRG